MTELPEGRITAGKIQADELQIHLGDQPVANAPLNTETKIVKPPQNRPQSLMWWIMLIIVFHIALKLFSTIITCGPMLFANVTRICLPSFLCSNQ